MPHLEMTFGGAQQLIEPWHRPPHIPPPRAALAVLARHAQRLAVQVHGQHRRRADFNQTQLCDAALVDLQSPCMQLARPVLLL